ncbi:hypothetical protein [Mycobacterium uberis]|uniref:hypothetical protein n=1 Tax=Mycobacterium uberis TaxID=2162698 RepID=UPI001FB39A6E|nr:hypothetical protein [Mycobacterium uberis]
MLTYGSSAEHPAVATRQVTLHRTDKTIEYLGRDFVDRIEQGYLRRSYRLQNINALAI